MRKIKTVIGWTVIYAICALSWWDWFVFFRHNGFDSPFKVMRNTINDFVSDKPLEQRFYELEAFLEAGDGR